MLRAAHVDEEGLRKAARELDGRRGVYHMRGALAHFVAQRGGEALEGGREIGC